MAIRTIRFGKDVSYRWETNNRQDPFDQKELERMFAEYVQPALYDVGCNDTVLICVRLNSVIKNAKFTQKELVHFIVAVRCTVMRWNGPMLNCTGLQGLWYDNLHLRIRTHCRDISNSTYIILNGGVIRALNWITGEVPEKFPYEYMSEHDMLSYKARKIWKRRKKVRGTDDQIPGQLEFEF